MPDYLFLMHHDAPDAGGITAETWTAYIGELEALGQFQGGSAIGDGVCARKSGSTPPITACLGGFLRVTAADLTAAQALLAGNPVFEAGGTVEIRALPRSD
jgi:hypothetical protein